MPTYCGVLRVAGTYVRTPPLLCSKAMSWFRTAHVAPILSFFFTINPINSATPQNGCKCESLFPASCPSTCRAHR
jgi:hypothetical protein